MFWGAVGVSVKNQKLFRMLEYSKHMNYELNIISTIPKTSTDILEVLLPTAFFAVM